MGQSYRDLDAWQRSMDLVTEIYALSKSFPREEQFGLVNQIRRAAISIPSNIAEGQGRIHAADFIRFLSIARGSLAETETQLLLAVRLEYIDRDSAKPAWALAQNVGRLLNGLINSLERKRLGAPSNGKIAESDTSYEVEYETTFDEDLPSDLMPE